MTPFLTALVLWSCSAGETDRWRIQQSDGEVVEASLQSIDADMNLVLGDSTTLAGRKVVSLERIGSPRPPWPTEAHLAFVNGDRLVGSPVECDQRTVMLNTAIANPPTMKVPLSRVDTIWFVAPSEMTSSSHRDNPKRDRVTLRNGDRLAGSLSSLLKEEKQLKMEIDSKPKSIPIDQLASIHLNSELRSDRVPDQPYWQCTLRNGSRISLLSMRLANDTLTGSTLFKAEVKIPLSDVVALDRLHKQSIWLSSLKPTRFDSTPYLTETLSWQADRNPNRMQLSVQTRSGVHHFDRGISMQSKSTLTYSLEGEYEWFFAEVGLDPQLGKEGNVDLKISLDGRAVELPNLKGLTVKAGAVPIRVKLDGVKRLALEVDWGEGGPVGDVVNWGQARLLKK